MAVPLNSSHPTSTLSRRGFCAWLASWGAWGATPAVLRAQTINPATPPETGDLVPGLESFDAMMRGFITDFQVPGASLAIGWQGRLQYARGFGMADPDGKLPVAPHHLFRIASVTKPLTAVAVLKAVEQGKLKLEDRVLPLLGNLPGLDKATPVDERWKDITVRHCLQHRGGWDRAASFDPIARPAKIREALDISFPVQDRDIIRYMLRHRLDHDPGSAYAYSNLGYLVLGCLLEVVHKRPFAEILRHEVWDPIQRPGPCQGRGLLKHCHPDEVRYVDRAARKGPAVLPPQVGETVPIQYGHENFDAFGAHGGWIASPSDLVCFAAALDGDASPRLLSPSSLQTLWAPPPEEAPDAGPVHYGCGWQVRRLENGKINTWHGGFIAGSEALLVRRWDGWIWAVTFNTATAPNGKGLVGLIDPLLHRAAAQAKAGP